MGLETLKYILFDNGGIIRSGWRAAAFLFAFVFTSFIAGAAQLVVVSALRSKPEAATLAGFGINGLILTIAALVLGWGCGKLFEKLPFRAIGAYFTPGWFVHLVAGCIAGGAALSLAVAVAAAIGGERFAFDVDSGVTDIAVSLVISLLVFGAAAAFEETLFRGYLLQTFARSGLAWVAIAVTSVFFGLVHLGNPNATAIATVNTMLAGLMFSVAYLKTRDLWFTWGLHLMWNWMQGSFFGIEVSGLTNISTAPLLREIDSGPTWLTGSNYGIEGGAACTLALLVTTVLIWLSPFGHPDAELLAMTSPPPSPASSEVST